MHPARQSGRYDETSSAASYTTLLYDPDGGSLAYYATDARAEVSSRWIETPVRRGGWAR